MDEIKEMREQMAAMKRSLDKYAIINDTLIDTVLKKRSQGLNWFVNAEIISIPVLCLFFFGFCYAMEMTIWIAITMTAGCIVSVIFDMKTMRVPSGMISSSNLQELRYFLVRQKRNRTIQLLVETPFCVVWIIWFMLAYFDNDVLFGTLKDSETFQWVKIILVAVVLIIAGIAVMLIYNKSQKVNDDMLKDIDTVEDI